jgi:hypothetical protein
MFRLRDSESRRVQGVAFLLPAGYAPPLWGGQAQLPQELLDMPPHSRSWSVQTSRSDAPARSRRPLATWTYTGADILPASAGNARINLWLLNGAPPSDAQPVEVIVTAFAFTLAHQSDVR